MLRIAGMCTQLRIAGMCIRVEPVHTKVCIPRSAYKLYADFTLCIQRCPLYAHLSTLHTKVWIQRVFPCGYKGYSLELHVRPTWSQLVYEGEGKGMHAYQHADRRIRRIRTLIHTAHPDSSTPTPPPHIFETHSSSLDRQRRKERQARGRREKGLAAKVFLACRSSRGWCRRILGLTARFKVVEIDKHMAIDIGHVTSRYEVAQR